MFLEIDTEILGRLMKKQRLSRSELATKIGVSQKTVQRWRTGSVRRIKPEMLAKLASILNVNPESILIKGAPNEAKVFNRNLDAICSAFYVQKIRSFNEWGEYRKALKAFPLSILPVRQKMVLFKHLGFSSLFVGKIKAGKHYLENALLLANGLKCLKDSIEILNWLSIQALLAGKLLEALEIISEAENRLALVSDKECISDFLFKKSRVFHNLERAEEAAVLTRKSILLDYQLESPSRIDIANKYTYLGETYLRLRKFEKAYIAFLRAEKAGRQSGWVDGQIYCHYCFAVIKILLGQPPRSVWSHIGKAKRFIRYSHYNRINSQPERIKFLYYLLEGNVSEAKTILKRRIEMARPFTNHFAYSIVDALIFSKLYSDSFKVRPHSVRKAEDYFKANGLSESLKVLEYVRKKETLTFSQGREIYFF